MNTLNIQAGKFPFKYLGVPLSTKKLAYIQCKPLINKVLARDNSWTNIYLSYAGRLQLARTILLSLQSLWCQIFVIPKKVVQEIQSYRWIFLWTSDTIASKKALVLWANMCLPRSADGWNIKDMEIWNKVVVWKLLWAITHKEDKLWVRWVDSSMWRVGLLLVFIALQLCHGILRRSEYGANTGWSAVLKHRVFSFKLMYQNLCWMHSKVPWRRVICKNQATPNSLFILWIAI